MENAPDSRPGKKPTPKAAAKPGPVRKPATPRKPVAKKPTPPVRRPVKPPVVVPAPETAADEVEETPVEAVEEQAAEAEVVEEQAAETEVVGPEVVEPERTEAEPEAEVGPEPEPEPEVEIEPEPEPEVEPESATEPEPEAEPDTVAAPESPRFTLPKLTVPKLTAQRAAIGRAVKAATARRGTAEVEETVDLAQAPAEASVAPSTAVTKTAGTAVRPKRKTPAARKSRAKVETILTVSGLTKRFDDNVAVDSIDLTVNAGAFYGIVGPNGAGKTTTLSMITGLLRPDAGTVTVHGADVWSDPVVAKRTMGVLPDRLRLFDRLTGAQLLYYAGILRGMDAMTVKSRTADLARAFGLEDALGRLVSDYSAGMTKKVALAAAMIHSPRLLVLDEPFESVDPVSASTVTDILKKYVSAGGTVLLSSHSMDLVQRICDHVAVVVDGRILADGTMASVLDGGSLEERFRELAGSISSVEGLEWLHSFSD